MEITDDATHEPDVATDAGGATAQTAPSFAAGLAKIAEGLDELFAAGFAPGSVDAARVMVQALEGQARRVDAARVKMLDVVDRSGAHRLDGHRSAKIMCRHLGRLAPGQATIRDQSARALRQMPLLAAAFADGRVSADQVAVVARAFANPRIQSQVAEMDVTFTALACRGAVDYRDFDRQVRSWADRADEDGTVDRFARTHANRDAKFVQDFDGSWHLSGGCGANDGAEFRTILDRFVDELFTAEWDEAKVRLGHDDIAVTDLARTPQQRRWDALLEMARRAASTLPGTSGSQVVTNIVIDRTTFERYTARYAGAPVPPDDPSRPDHRCETLDGHPIDPAAAIATALIGHVRRVVIDERGVVINQSRKVRLFRDGAALAARMTATTCYWPGCWVPVTACQIDHLIPHADHGGPTDQDNAAPACGHHNRFRNNGYHAERLPDGTIATYRPDGSLIS